MTGAAFMLAACVSMAPSYEVPVLPVASSYAESAAQALSQTASIGWREYFTDPDLQALIAAALDNNRDLRIAVLRVEEARATYGIQRSAQFPNINAQAGMDRSRTPADLNITRKPLLVSQYQVALGLASWEIDFWGRISSLKEAALENYLASDEARRAVSIALIAQVANGYLGLREMDERIALANQTTVSREDSLRIFTRRVEVGSSSRLELTQVQTLLTQAQGLRAQLQMTRATQVNALTLLVGTPIDMPAMQNQSNSPEILIELTPGLPSELLINRPDIVAAEHQLKASHANIGAARAAFFPRIALTGSLGTASAELSGLFASGSLAWSFSPSISLPIFDGGRNRNNLDLAEVRRDLAVANYEKTVQSAFRDVSDALAARHWLSEQVGIAQAALRAQTERARLSQLRYDNGASTFLEILDAQRELLVAEQQLVQTRRTLLSSRVSLYAALGGGLNAASSHSASDTPKSLEPARAKNTP
ncbi:efflux transporter outer membrane subunit [Uliginosibacterium flavum]